MSERKRISLSCSVWFWICLFFFAAQPCLHSGEERGAAESLFQSMSNACDGVGDVGLRHLRRGHTEGTDNRVSSFPECSVNTFGMFNVFSPLFESKGRAGFANNSSFFGSSGRGGLDPSYQGGRNNPKDHSRKGNKGSDDVIIHDDETASEMLWGAVLALGGFIVGWGIVTIILILQNAEDRHE